MKACNVVVVVHVVVVHVFIVVAASTAADLIIPAIWHEHIIKPALETFHNNNNHNNNNNIMNSNMNNNNSLFISMECGVKTNYNWHSVTF